MRCVSRSAAILLVLFAALLPARIVMAQTRFPEVAKLPSHPEFPDPLVMFDGQRVTSKEQWFDKRRPELKALFQHYMYGYLLPPEKIAAKVEREDAKAFGGKA